MNKKNKISMTPTWNSVQTSDGSWTLVHTDHSEWYHSADGALSEARDLYIRSSGLIDFLQSGRATRVLDVGLGLGYNALATLDAWDSCGRKKGCLDLVSLESDAALFAAFRTGEAPWQQGWIVEWRKWVQSLHQTADGCWQSVIGDVTWRVVLADALTASSRDFVTRAGLFDFVWQDPFSPEKNPLMWGGEWFSFVGSVTRGGGILMTYSVASSVRDALQDNGWRVEKIPTTTRKKNWLKAFRLALPGEPT